jgi:sirohydrochlorin cobaltochelatase
VLLTTAYLLVTHGSRDPRPQRAAERVVRALAMRAAADLGGDPGSNPIAALSCPVRATFAIAQLECADRPLHQVIVDWAQAATRQGAQQLQVVPLFLLQGVHVAEDIPAEVSRARSLLPGATGQREGTGAIAPLRILPPIGSDPSFVTLVQQQQKTMTEQHPNLEAWVLLSHGSRRAQGNAAAAVIAEQVGAIAAYWSVEPSLDTSLMQLARQGKRRIGILPYVLFTGGLTDAIAQRVNHHQRTSPHLHLVLGHPLDHHSQLVDWLAAGLLGDRPAYCRRSSPRWGGS